MVNFKIFLNSVLRGAVMDIGTQNITKSKNVLVIAVDAFDLESYLKF